MADMVVGTRGPLTKARYLSGSRQTLTLTKRWLKEPRSLHALTSLPIPSHPIPQNEHVGLSAVFPGKRARAHVLTSFSHFPQQHTDSG